MYKNLFFIVFDYFLVIIFMIYLLLLVSYLLMKFCRFKKKYSLYNYNILYISSYVNNINC